MQFEAFGGKGPKSQMAQKSEKSGTRDDMASKKIESVVPKQK